MGLPVVVGGKSSSLRPIAPPSCYEGEVNLPPSASLLQPVALDSCGPCVAMAVSADHVLSATVSVSFLDMMAKTKEGTHCECTVAEVRIQIGFLAEPFDSTTRDLLHRVVLPDSGSKPGAKTQEEIMSERPLRISVVFASDDRHLAVLIPYPRKTTTTDSPMDDTPSSVVVIFQLRKPRNLSRNSPKSPPLPPSYVLRSSPTTSSSSSTTASPASSASSSIPHRRIVPIATNPKLVCLNRTKKGEEGEAESNSLKKTFLANAASICNISTGSVSKSGMALLLVACWDCSVWVVPYRQAEVAGNIYSSNGVLLRMKHWACSEERANSNGTTSDKHHGRLLVLDQAGKISVLTTACIKRTHQSIAKAIPNDNRVTTLQQQYPATNHGGNNDSSTNNGKESDQYGTENGEKARPGNNDGARRTGDPRHDMYSNSDTSEKRQRPSQTEAEPQVLVFVLQYHSTIEGDFSDGEWIAGDLLALLSKPKPKQTTLVQVFACDDEHMFGGTTAGLEPLTTLSLTPERLEEVSHGTFFLQHPPSETTNENNRSETTTSPGNLSAAENLHYDPRSGCLAVSSVLVEEKHSDANSGAVEFLGHPFSCIWHWRTNVLGFTLRARDGDRLAVHQTGANDGSQFDQPTMSQLWFAGDTRDQQRLVHISCVLPTQWQRNGSASRLRKQIFEAGLLSPRSGLGLSHSCIEPMPLMISSQSVTFPLFYKTSSMADGEIEWRDSRVPQPYVASHGTPIIGCIGRRYCRSIAIAGSHGLCILDCSRMRPLGPASVLNGLDSSMQSLSNLPSSPVSLSDPMNSVGAYTMSSTRYGRTAAPKWRLFGESEERSFRVIAMTWWEGDGNKSDHLEEYRADDLLVAVIERTVDPAQRGATRPPRYLACWSRRRLDLSHQLLDPALAGHGRWGVLLPHDFSPDSISLLADPSSLLVETEEAKMIPSTSRKSVVVLSSLRARSGSSFVVFRLQVVKDSGTSGASDPVQDRPYWVKSSQAARGAIKTVSSEESVGGASLFLASASFAFDLELEHDSFAQNRVASSSTVDPMEFVATFGLIQQSGGFKVLVATTIGIVLTADLLQEIFKPSAVSSFYLSDIVVGSRFCSGWRNTVDSYFVWSVILCNGLHVCWFAPYVDAGHNKTLKPSAIMEQKEKPTSKAMKRLRPLCPVFPGNSTIELVGGSVAWIGDASMWMLGSIKDSRTDFAVGSIPLSNHGCILQTGQLGRGLHRTVPGNETHDSAFVSNFLDHEVFCLKGGVMTSPAFLPSLLSCLISGLHDSENDKSLRQHFLARLQCATQRNTVFMAIRLLVLRTVEWLTSESRSPFALSIFSDVVHTMRESFPTVNFAWLLLGIARQVEPGSVANLFPLPLSNTLSDEDGDESSYFARNQYLQTVEDLYVISTQEGSLTIPSLALSLLSSKIMSLEECSDILYHCLWSIKSNSECPGGNSFDFSSQERSFVRDLFRFGTHLEDLDETEFWGDQDVNIVLPAVGSPIRQRRKTNREDVVEPSSPVIRKPLVEQSRLTKERPRRSISSYLLPSSIVCSGRKNREERAVYESASQFIVAGFEEGDYEAVESIEDAPSVPALVDRRVGMTWMVAVFIVGTCLPRRGQETAATSWRFASSLVRAVLQQDSQSELLPAKPSTLEDWDSRVKWKMLSVAVVKLTGEDESASAEQDSSSAAADLRNGISEYLLFVMRRCEAQVNKQEAAATMDFALLLLYRLRPSASWNQVVGIGLVFVAAASAHVAGRANELVEKFSDKSPLGRCYKLALERLHHDGDDNKTQE